MTSESTPAPAARPTLALLLLLLASASVAAAQEHPNVARGFSPTGVYQHGGLDHVNVFNGGLTLTVPLGPIYPVGGGLSYSFLLVYSSSPWTFTTRTTSDQLEYTRGTFGRPFNAGLGWRLSLGELLPPGWDGGLSGWTYCGPDGAQHAFYPRLHEEDPEDPEDLGPTPRDEQRVMYSRDGSYLRMKRLADGTREVEHPSGEVHRFDATGRLVRIWNRFSQAGSPVNFVDVSYSNGGLTTTVRDSHGRVHTLEHDEFSTEVGRTLRSLTLSAFSDSDVTPGTAVYDFAYQSLAVPRPKPHNDPAISPAITVPFLTGVRLPHGLAFEMSLAGPRPDYLLAPPDGRMIGLLSGIKTPSRGRYEWDYQMYVFSPPGPRDAWREKNAGVWKRRLIDPIAGVSGEWVYQTERLAGASGAPPPFDRGPDLALKNTLVDPLGHRTESYFSIYRSGAVDFESGARAIDYALPITVLSPDPEVSPPVDSAGRHLSTRVFDAGGRLLRSTYLRHERDRAGLVAVSPGSAADHNLRVVSTATVYHDDLQPSGEPRRSWVDFSSFDGLGHYRWSVTGGNFPGGNGRAEGTNYNPSSGVYTESGSPPPGFAAFSMPPSSAPWVLETFSFVQVGDDGGNAFQEHCFDPATGFHLGTRTYAGTGPVRGPADVVVRHTRDAAGNLAREEYFGGDVQPLSTAELCGGLLPGQLPPAVVIVDHQYEAGARSRSRYLNADLGQVGPYLLDLDIDRWTGLPRRSREASNASDPGLSTTYVWDALGRLVQARPEGKAWTLYDFPVPASGPLWARLRRVDAAGALIGETATYFDGFGRVYRESRSLPGAGGATVAAMRETRWDAAGNRASISDWGDGAPSSRRTQFLRYDPFGRYGVVRPPDSPSSSRHDLRVTYLGVRAVTRESQVGSVDPTTGSVSERATSVFERYDRHGRLAEVVEPSGTGGALVTTSYSYDVGSRVTRTSASGAGAAQVRERIYDNRGFLLRETLPERDGVVRFGGYDPRGKAGSRQESGRHLGYVFDRAERLVEVRDRTQAAADRQLLKRFVYATANDRAARDFRLGQVIERSGFNYPMLGGVQPYRIELRERLEYRGLGGQLSRRVLESYVKNLALGGPDPITPSEVFEQGFAWNLLGDVETLDYPRCAHAGCGATSARTVRREYRLGRLVVVRSGDGDGRLFGSFAYHPSGTVSTVAHGNGVLDEIQADPTHPMRPGRLLASRGGTILWDSGDYVYDGAANILKTGDSWYSYDGVNRLVASRVGLRATPAEALVSRRQDYRYDPFGNIVETLTDNSLVLSPTALANNRLQAAGAAYDAFGNLTRWGGNSYSWDVLDRLTRHTVDGGEDWYHVYDASDERVWSFRPGGAFTSRWALRDLAHRLLREYRNSGGIWSIERDHVQGAETLLVSIDPARAQDPERHFSADHLGTPRLSTSTNGTRVAFHVYFPFGEEATWSGQDAERVKFTGQESDLGVASSQSDDVYNLHARHYGPLIGRFLSVDPRDGKPGQPRTLNRYAYVVGNPLRLVDPNGQSGVGFLGTKILNKVLDRMHGVESGSYKWLFGKAADAVEPVLDAVEEQALKETTGTNKSEVIAELPYGEEINLSLDTWAIKDGYDLVKAARALSGAGAPGLGSFFAFAGGVAMGLGANGVITYVNDGESMGEEDADRLWPEGSYAPDTRLFQLAVSQCRAGSQSACGKLKQLLPGLHPGGVAMAPPPK